MNKSDYKDIQNIIIASKKRGNLVQLAEMAARLSGAVVTTSQLGNTKIHSGNRRTVYPVHLAALQVNDIKGPIFFDAELVKEMAQALIAQAAELDRLRGNVQTVARTETPRVELPPSEESDAARIAREMDNMMKDLSRLESELNSLQNQ